MKRIQVRTICSWMTWYSRVFNKTWNPPKENMVPLMIGSIFILQHHTCSPPLTAMIVVQTSILTRFQHWLRANIQGSKRHKRSYIRPYGSSQRSWKSALRCFVFRNQNTAATAKTQLGNKWLWEVCGNISGEQTANINIDYIYCNCKTKKWKIGRTKT